MAIGIDFKPKITDPHVGGGSEGSTIGMILGAVAAAVVSVATAGAGAAPAAIAFGAATSAAGGAAAGGSLGGAIGEATDPSKAGKVDPATDQAQYSQNAISNRLDQEQAKSNVKTLRDAALQLPNATPEIRQQYAAPLLQAYQGESQKLQGYGGIV